ncbi:serine/threonine protein kinase [Geodermatophilus marinus]|nr:serine/threonine protein kinase [Geodermatophilus sp. LHW52908]
MPAPGNPDAPVVPGYRLEHLLGRGASGEVWRAVPRAGGTPVAVKVLVAGDPERQAREAALLGALDHPHLVRLVEVVHQPRRGGPPRVALVLELLPGGSLAALLARRGRLRPGEVVTAVAPVAAALACAHEQGVVHGDLSPGNVVFTAEGRPVLTDLGVARVLGEEAAAEVTPAYVDPVVARGGAPDPSSDVFGVAAAAFHALTGVAPWNAATPADTLRVAAAGELPDLTELAPGAPPELLAVIARGLDPHPHRRGTAAAFALDLRHACRPEPVELGPPGPGDRAAGSGAGTPARTELTHQVPGRHRREPPRVVDRAPLRRRLAGRLRVGALRMGALRTGGLRPGAVRAAAVLAVLLAVVAVAVALAPGPADPPPAAAPGAAPGGTAAPGTAPGGAAAPSTAPGGPPSQPPAAEVGEGSTDGFGEGPRADWRAVLEDLYEVRASAFATSDPVPLDRVHAPGSPLLTADRAAVEALRAAGHRLEGFAPRVVQASVVSAGEGRVVLAVVDEWAAYAVVEAPGTAPVQTVGPRGPSGARITLVGGDDGWRIAEAQTAR